MTSVLTRLGLTRDSAILWAGLLAGVVGFLGGHFELLQKAFPTLGVVWQARIELASGLLALVSAFLRMSPLQLSPSNEMASRDAGQTLTMSGKLPMVLLAIALAGAGATLPACASAPPTGTYTPAVTKQYQADQFLKDLDAIGQTARNLNAAIGKEHLSDLNTSYVRDFSIIAAAGANAWGNGATTLALARTAVDAAALPAGYAPIVRAAFDKAVDDYGAGASPLVIAIDAYTVLRAKLSVDATTNPKLAAALAAIDAGIAAMPKQ